MLNFFRCQLCAQSHSRLHDLLVVYRQTCWLPEQSARVRQSFYRYHRVMIPRVCVWICRQSCGHRVHVCENSTSCRYAGCNQLRVCSFCHIRRPSSLIICICTPAVRVCWLVYENFVSHPFFHTLKRLGEVRFEVCVASDLHHLC